MNRYRRAPFLLFHWDGAGVLVEDADTGRRHRCSPKLIPLLSPLADWVTHEQLRASGSTLSESELDRLVSVGLLELEAEAGERPDLEAWTPLRLAMHRRTGGCAERIAYKPNTAVEGEPVALPPPEPVTCALADVLRNRRSRRVFAPSALELETVSTLLFHAAGSQPGRHRRPYPTGGGLDELRLYLLIDRVDALDSGAYRYEPDPHAVVPLTCAGEVREARLAAVATELGGEPGATPPAVLLLIVADLTRAVARYQDLALSLVHKDVGGLTQTLHIVATALGLAACPIGRGDDPMTSALLALEQRREVPVGAIAFSCRAAD